MSDKKTKETVASEKEAKDNVEALLAEFEAKANERMALMESMLGKLVDVVEKQSQAKPEVPVSKEEAAILSAGPNRHTTNPEWEAAARDILGDYLDHTEVAHERTGGIMFTVVIRTDKSNAGADYLSRTKTDRRTKEVGALGMDGVTEWCKLIRSNLKRTEAK